MRGTRANQAPILSFFVVFSYPVARAFDVFCPQCALSFFSIPKSERRCQEDSSVSFLLLAFTFLVVDLSFESDVSDVGVFCWPTEFRVERQGKLTMKHEGGGLLFPLSVSFSSGTRAKSKSRMMKIVD